MKHVATAKQVVKEIVFWVISGSAFVATLIVIGSAALIREDHRGIRR